MKKSKASSALASSNRSTPITLGESTACTSTDEIAPSLFPGELGRRRSRAMLLPRSQPAFAVPIADMPILCTLSILSEPGEQLVLLCTPLYFDQLSPQLRILLLCRLEHS